MNFSIKEWLGINVLFLLAGFGAGFAVTFSEQKVSFWDENGKAVLSKTNDSYWACRLSPGFLQSQLECLDFEQLAQPSNVESL